MKERWEGVKKEIMEYKLLKAIENRNTQENTMQDMNWDQYKLNLSLHGKVWHGLLQYDFAGNTRGGIWGQDWKWQLCKWYWKHPTKYHQFSFR
jgi:hypothetical protein